MKTEELYRLYLSHPDISTDSRDIRSGCLFFALKGPAFNGNAFAAEAIEKGAAGAVIDDPAYRAADRYFLVEDALDALQQLAALHRTQLKIPVIAITGTNGKTTTKELAGAVLSKGFRTVVTEGNFNNHIGVPLTLLRAGRETGLVLLEMGANHPGEIDFLCRIGSPTHGLITNIGKAHLEGFGGFEGVVRTKTELYGFLRENHGTVFLDLDDPLLVEKSGNLERFTYGMGSAPDVRATGITADPFVGMDIHYGKGTIHADSRLFGKYNAQNILAAAAMGFYYGIAPEKISDAIKQYNPINNRSQILKTERNLLVLDAYNANPTSMKLAIRNFMDTSYPDKMMILGDMYELGEESEKEHQAILDLVEKLEKVKIFLVGPEFTRLNHNRERTCFHDSELARLWFGHHRPMGATILLKGSRGMKMEKISEVL
jgi:UDP-N-acetylmuramoyl-tripeptide--D-alanyl-D-alanine ligase